jgi:TonB family protein
MTLRSWHSLSTLALTCWALACSGTAAADIGELTGCSKPTYPRLALKRGEDGISLLGFLVRADGTPVRSMVVDSSGYAALDEATAEALMQCRWKPRTGSDGPAERWVLLGYWWVIEDDPNMAVAKNQAAVDARKGDVAARYRISRLLEAKPKSDQDRRDSLTLLGSAAELGHAPAQFALGRRYEKGDGVTSDVEEALRWYRKAADQGNVFAIQRLEKGFLPE